MKPTKTAQIVKTLRSNGFTLSHQAGSHMTFKNSLSGKVAVMTDTKYQTPGTMRNIEKTSGVNFEETKVKKSADSLPVKFWDVVSELGLNPFQLSESDKKIVLELC